MVVEDHSHIVWFVENSYTAVSSHFVGASKIGLWVVVIEEHNNCFVRLSMRHWSLRLTMSSSAEKVWL